MPNIRDKTTTWFKIETWYIRTKRDLRGHLYQHSHFTLREKMKPQREVPKVLTPTILIIARKKVLCKAVTSTETRETNYVLINYSWNHVSCYSLKVLAMGRRTNPPLPVQQQAKATSCSGYQSLPHNCWPLGEPLPEKRQRGNQRHSQVLQSSHPLTPPPRLLSPPPARPTHTF